MKKNRRKLKIGQRVIFPKYKGEFEKSRPGTVIAEHPTYYTARLDAGYLESVPAYGQIDIKICK